MILSNLEISSFAALSSLRLELEPGINVVLGANEAGKSTLFKALQHLLLTPVDLNKRRFRELMQPFLPVGGGDTIRAALEFLVEGRHYRLEKCWGAAAAVELHTSDGARITQSQSVEEQLLQLLPVNPGTMRTVLLTGQSALSSTVKELQSDKDTVYGLNDLLHKSVLETDGISVGRFTELLDSRCEQLLKHWDRQRERPEKKRGADTRWSRDRGTVLEAFYELEDAEAHQHDVAERETALGTLTEQLELHTRELSEKEERLKSIAQEAKDAEQRMVLEVKMRETELSLKEVQQDYELWTKSALRAETLEKELPRLEEAAEQLLQEKRQAEEQQRKRSLLERFERIRAQRERLRQAEAECGRTPSISRAQLEQLRAGAAKIDQLKASLEAGNLSLTLHAKQSMDLVAQKDMEEAAERHLDEEEILSIEAAGRIQIQQAGWTLEVYSGEGEFRTAAEQYEQARLQFEQLLQQLGMDSLHEAEEAGKRYETLLNEVQSIKRRYEEDLGEESFETLQEHCGGGVEKSVLRELSQILEELVRKQSRLTEVQAVLEDDRRQLETLSARYTDKESLFARIAELGGLKGRLSETITGLSPLPEGYDDARSLLQYFEALREEVEALHRERIRLESDCRNAEASMPDESSEEASGRIRDARERFEAQLSKAEVLLRIKTAAVRILDRLDRGIERPFTELVSRYLAALSGDRYRELASGDSTIPASVIRGDGQALPYELLSAGTKDLFSLALRLAMAEFFLGDGEGFLILDDPLVDLDPERQKRAAEVLAAFNRQLLFFTCQPAHAELLGKAHRIELRNL